MPTGYVKKIAAKKGVPVDAIESKWEKAKQASSDPENYALITSIFKKMVGEDYSVDLGDIDLFEETQELTESIASKIAKHMGLKYMGFGYWGDGEHATHKSEGGSLLPLHGKFPMQRSPAGTLGKLPDAWKNTVVGRFSDDTYGDQSPVQHTHPDEKLTSFSKFKSHMTKVMSEGPRVVYITVDGAPAGMIKRESGYGARPEYNAFSAEAQRKGKTHVGGKWRGSGKHRWFQPASSYEKSNLTKGEAFDTLYGSLADWMEEDETLESKSFWKRHTVEVHGLGTDSARQKEQQDRQANKPAMQTNYQRDTNARGTDDRVKVSSYTPKGDMSAIKQAAAQKFVDKKLGQGDHSETAANIEKLHDLMKSGASEREIRAHFEDTLKKHQKQTFDQRDRESIVRDLSKDDYYRRWALKSLRQKMGKTEQ